MSSDAQTKVKETLIQVFDQLSIERKSEVLEFALFMHARESQNSLAASTQTVDAASPSPVSPSLQGSVLHYNDPLNPVSVEDWVRLQ